MRFFSFRGSRSFFCPNNRNSLSPSFLDKPISNDILKSLSTFNGLGLSLGLSERLLLFANAIGFKFLSSFGTPQHNDTLLSSFIPFWFFFIFAIIHLFGVAIMQRTIILAIHVGHAINAVGTIHITILFLCQSYKHAIRAVVHERNELVITRLFLRKYRYYNDMCVYIWFLHAS